MFDVLRLIFVTGPTVYLLLLVGIGTLGFIGMILRLTIIYLWNARHHGRGEAMSRIEREIP